MTGSINVGLASYECDMLAKLSDDLNMAQADVLAYGLKALSALRWAGEMKLWAFHQADPTQLPFVVLNVDGEKMPGGQGGTIDEALIAAKIHDDACYREADANG